MENYTVSKLKNPDRQAATEVKTTEPAEMIIDPLEREYAVITIENAEDSLTRVVKIERVHPYLCLECGFNGLEPASKEFSKLFTADNFDEMKPAQKSWLQKGMDLHKADGHKNRQFLHTTVELKKARQLPEHWKYAENPNPTAAEPKIFPKVWTN